MHASVPPFVLTRIHVPAHVSPCVFVSENILLNFPTSPHLDDTALNSITHCVTSWSLWGRLEEHPAAAKYGFRVSVLIGAHACVPMETPEKCLWWCRAKSTWCGFLISLYSRLFVQFFLLSFPVFFTPSSKYVLLYILLSVILPFILSIALSIPHSLMYFFSSLGLMLFLIYHSNPFYPSPTFFLFFPCVCLHVYLLFPSCIFFPFRCSIGG